MRRPARLALVPPLFAAGLATGVASTGLHDRSWAWFALAVAAPVSAALALSAGWWRTSFAAGWVLVVTAAVRGRPEGDYAVAADGRGYAFLLVALGLVVLAVASTPVGARPGRRASRARRGAAESGS
ncbi:hypothetical protein [Nocardioides donggukensis]|uniref:Uncharacterized protein n=1 Tax=Nocardioides donggukensis TaxID=2774019 RepID=A0A927K702_9ACTN|nr:hypothetical protein [Nocardioides donggukensis]MBD8870320.1 hypothetical protein [Nocardioides donggukensis]